MKNLFKHHKVLLSGVAEHELDPLVDLVAYFRPKNLKKTVSITPLLVFLTENPLLCEQFSNYIKAVFKNKNFGRMLANAGILQDMHFISEVKKRLYEKILPSQPEKSSVEYILNQVFHHSSDYIWVQKIPAQQLIELFDLLNLQDIYTQVGKNSPLIEIFKAIGLLSQRMSGRVMEDEVLDMAPEFIHLDSPFVALEKEILLLEDRLYVQQQHFTTSDDLNYKQILILIHQSEKFIEKAFHNSSKYGITLKVNQNLLRIKQQLERISKLIQFLIVDTPQQRKQNSIALSLKLIEYNCYKNNISNLVKDSTRILSYEITQHTARTGENYITETRSEYMKMLYIAMGGGFIVGLLCVIKLLFSKIDTSDFGHAVLYSLNYALGFIAIYLMGFTLATKQPAMTAAAIARALEEGMLQKTDPTEKHRAFARLFARLFRSQFIAFVGNVIVAFPVALAVIWLIDYGTGVNIAQTKAPKLIGDLNPITSLAIFHASIAGIYLFISGIISGSVSNSNKFHNIYYRIQENPTLKRNFGSKGTKKLAHWFEKKWPGVVSNGWFGVFLGSTASIGIFLGLNLDIRHITFAAGNFAMGLYGTHFQIDMSTLLWSVIGIVLIGFFNFIVSFSLSLILALRSRGISFAELRLVNQAVWYYFKRNPLRFFIPTESKR